MKLLAIDYGRAKVGIAIGDTKSGLAEPLTVLRFKDLETLVEKIKRIINTEDIEKIVFGLSEGEVGKESKEFGEKLNKDSGIQIDYIDETLTSLDAQRLSIDAGINRKKRKGMEDAYSAALILQNYLENV